MTSLRQIEANRCNAVKVPARKWKPARSDHADAVRHGLISAETVIEIVEDIDD
jgi:hypothetical protein